MKERRKRRIKMNNKKSISLLIMFICCHGCFSYFSSAACSTLNFSHFPNFLFQFQSFHYFVGIFIGKVQKCFTKCSSNLFIVLLIEKERKKETRNTIFNLEIKLKSHKLFKFFFFVFVFRRKPQLCKTKQKKVAKTERKRSNGTYSR